MTKELSVNELQQESFRLRSLIMATKHIPTKRELQDKRAKLTKRIQMLTIKQHEEKEEQASALLDVLLRSDKYIMLLAVNGYRIELDEDLNITLQYEPCKHTQTMHIKEILRYRKSGDKSEQVLLAKWQATLGAKGILETVYYCEECRKAKERKRKLLRRFDNSPVGTTRLTLQII